jgi:hypothetical protein
MTKQGKADMKGAYDRKVEPNAKAVNPGAVSYLGEKLGNHTTESGDFPLNSTPWNAGRGYMAPSIGQKRHKTGSQGEY